MKLKCGICGEEIRVMETQSVTGTMEGTCKKCVSEVSEALLEFEGGGTWRFDPESVGDKSHHKPRYTMTHISRIEDDAMDDYEETEDESTIKTDRLKKDYEKANRDVFGLDLPTTKHLGS